MAANAPEFMQKTSLTADEYRLIQVYRVARLSCADDAWPGWWRFEVDFEPGRARGRLIPKAQVTWVEG
jgi:hypothetical protein